MADLFCMSLVSSREQKLFRLYFSRTKGRLSYIDALSPDATIWSLKRLKRVCLCYHLQCSLKIFINAFTFLQVKANSKEIGEEILFSIFFFSEKC